MYKLSQNMIADLGLIVNPVTEKIRFTGPHFHQMCQQIRLPFNNRYRNAVFQLIKRFLLHLGTELHLSINDFVLVETSVCSPENYLIIL